MFDYQSIICDNLQTNESFCNSLRINGYATVHINKRVDKSYFSDEEFEALNKWEKTYRNKFENITDREIRAFGKYRAEGGVAVGYRKDDGREFFETHIKERINDDETRDIEVIPHLHKPCVYSNNTVRCKKYPNELCASVISMRLIQLLRRIGYHTLVQVARSFSELNHLPRAMDKGACCPETQDSCHSYCLYPGDSYFVDMTDCSASGLLENPPNSKTKNVNSHACSSAGDNRNFLEEDGDEIEYTYSSSVLRVCHYPEESKLINLDVTENIGEVGASLSVQSSKVSTNNLNDLPPPPEALHASKPVVKSYGFGAHTDTSFITIGLCNALQPGLEMLNRETNSWTSVESDIATLLHNQINSEVGCSESDCQDYFCTIFVGEFLQILTNHAYKAVVHRVLAPTSPNTTLGLTNPNLPNCRISCPLIVRGKNKVVINSKRYASFSTSSDDYGKAKAETDTSTTEAPTGSNASLVLSDLYDGLNMKVVHMLLDKKRSHCMRKHHATSTDIDWILSAFPEMHQQPNA